MRLHSKRYLELALESGRPFVVFIIGSILVHFSVMLIDYYLLVKPLYLNLREDFFGGVFSALMIPMIAAYGLFSVTVFFLWQKKRKAIIAAREHELEKEKVEAVLKSMQRLTVMVAQQIATHNSEIRRWIESSKRKGKTISPKLEIPNRKIGEALHSLSEVSFVFPYTRDRPKDLADVETTLLEKLEGLERLRNSTTKSGEGRQAMRI